jgi:hypothetical protein
VKRLSDHVSQIAIRPSAVTDHIREVSGHFFRRFTRAPSPTDGYALAGRKSSVAVGVSWLALAFQVLGEDADDPTLIIIRPTVEDRRRGTLNFMANSQELGLTSIRTDAAPARKIVHRWTADFTLNSFIAVPHREHEYPASIVIFNQLSRR